jgi:hypothetical protein
MRAGWWNCIWDICVISAIPWAGYEYQVGKSMRIHTEMTFMDMKPLVQITWSQEGGFWRKTKARSRNECRRMGKWLQAQTLDNFSISNYSDREIWTLIQKSTRPLKTAEIRCFVLGCIMMCNFSCCVHPVTLSESDEPGQPNLNKFTLLLSLPDLPN